MNDLGPLFANTDPGDEPSGPPTWSVLELNRAIEAALQDAFPGEIWLRGEIQGLARTRMRRHWYFDLVEKDPESDQVNAKISIALLNWNRSKVERMMRDAPGFELEDDVEVRIRCEMGFYPPWGRLQLLMTGVDPSFTLGQMAANRERILRALAAEGLLDRNAQLEMPLVPSRVGLVTSVGSAAYNDFVHEIENGGFGLQVVACDARVQGADTERTVVAALRTLVRHGCDVVVVARGGGSRSDLSGFDGEAIARAIATSPVPVLTGIGHEIDTSVADAVAHTAFKTPTACAAFLVERARLASERADDAWAAIARAAADAQRTHEERLLDVARGIARGAREAHRHRARDLDDRRMSLRREGPAAQARAWQRLQASTARSRQLVLTRLAGHQARLDLAARRLSPERIERSFARRAVALDRVWHRLGPAAVRRLQALERDLAGRDVAVRAYDPGRILRRGFSITTDADGQLVRDPLALDAGALLRTRVAAGTIESRVESGSTDPESPFPMPPTPPEEPA